MFEGFNLKLSINMEDGSFFEDALTIERMKKELKNTVFANSYRHLKNVSDYLNDGDGTLDADQIIGDWFPPNAFDIFLSHSHKDESLAIIIAYLFKKKCGLNVFIDSIFWGYSDELLREVDNKYAYNNDSNTYSYDVRNKTTSNVYLMLNSALIEVIDKSECLIFLNSENSIVQDSDTSKLYQNDSYTTSPWLMSELNFSSKARKVYPQRIDPTIKRHVSLEKSFVESASNVLQVKYKLPMNHLNELTEDNFKKWFEKIINSELNELEALDYLYKLTGLGYVNKGD